MNLDQALYKTIIDSGDKLTTSKMMSVLFFNLFEKHPYNTYEIHNQLIIDTNRPYNKNPLENVVERTIDIEKFHENILNLGYKRCMLDYDSIYVNEHFQIIVLPHDKFVKCVCNINDIDSNVLNNIKNCIVELDPEEDKIEIGILTQRNSLFYVEETEINYMDIDVEKTYNDDIPIEKIDDFITEPGDGLMLFYGEPGTGKTTYIRHLMQEHQNKNFIILDANLLYNITTHSLLNTFIEEKNAIYIIEDCEKLLVSRDNESNPIISAFLNMTDGILSQVMNCKFICTFNTEIDKIDEALLRKGRLKLKYEFKKLSFHKVKKLTGIDTNCDMTIADVIYYENENDYSKKKKQNIGFV